MSKEMQDPPIKSGITIYRSRSLDVSVYKSGRGEPFHWKIMPCPHSEALAHVTWETDGIYLNKHYFVPTRIQLFWLWFVIDLRIKKEYLSSTKMVRYEDTHYAAVDDALNQKPF